MNSVAHNIKIVIKGDVHINGSTHGDTIPPLYEDELLGEIVKQKPEITFNTTRTFKNGKKAPDGIEIRFGTARPTEAVRQELKDHGFHFSERQTMWYAIDNDQSRALIDKWVNDEVEVDTTQYEKRNFWARVKSIHDYEQLRERTEFWVKMEPPKYFYSKSYLRRAFNVQDLINSDQLYFKKYYNKVVGEDEPTSEGSTSNEEPASNADDSPVTSSGSSNHMSTTSNNESEDMELLQLEAEAELELLKMRVELERKRRMRPVEGIPLVNQDKLQAFRRKAWALQNKVDVLDFK